MQLGPFVIGSETILSDKQHDWLFGPQCDLLNFPMMFSEDG